VLFKISPHFKHVANLLHYFTKFSNEQLKLTFHKIRWKSVNIWRRYGKKAYYTG